MVVSLDMRLTLLLTTIALGCRVSEVAGATALPDTGITICYGNNSTYEIGSGKTSVARDVGEFPRQDCRYGADANSRLVKIGGGASGFDYTKISNNGAALPAGAALGTGFDDWACSRDNNTGLTWEVRTPTAGQSRFAGHLYAWRNSDPAINGGNSGSDGDTASCGNTLPGATCNTQSYTGFVNIGKLCSYTDWRMPSLRELQTLVHLGGPNPAIDSSYFPNTVASGYWSVSTYASAPASAWYLNFTDGRPASNLKVVQGYVRVVRGDPF